MFGEAVMAEPWDGVGEAARAEPIRHKRGLLGRCDAHTGGDTIEKSCSEILATHQRKCIFGKMKIF
jgi:hypothetical protein